MILIHSLDPQCIIRVAHDSSTWDMNLLNLSKSVQKWREKFSFSFAVIHSGAFGGEEKNPA